MAGIALARPQSAGLGLRFRAQKLLQNRHLLSYFWHHKFLFGVTNTKRDISFCVFRESFIDDQYSIRKFLSRIRSSRELTFIDIGRNHGLVFYYAMHYIMKHNIKVSTINYYGIDPSPLKFVYFNFHDYIRKHNITINYNIIDKAVVFNDAETVTLKYGEDNFGNFHVAGSNYAQRSESRQSRFEYVNITVQTMHFDEIRAIIDRHIGSDTMIVKIDCKNRTDFMFGEVLDYLSGRRHPNFLISAEADGSANRDLSRYSKPASRVLTTEQLH